MARSSQRSQHNSMKAEYKPGWRSSVQPRKQVKARANAPKHIKGKLNNATLSKELREKHQRRTIRVRTGDEVQIMKGTFKGHKGNVDSINLDKQRITVRGADAVKRDGSKRPLPIAISNVKITKLTEDKRRMKRNA